MQAGSIDKVGLVRLGAPTHGDDQGQRYVPLAFTASGSVLTRHDTGHAARCPAGVLHAVHHRQCRCSLGGQDRQARDGPNQPRATRSAATTTVTAKSDIAVWRPSTGQVVRPRGQLHDVRQCRPTSRSRRTTTVTGHRHRGVAARRPGGGMSAGRRRCTYGVKPGTYRSRRTTTVTGSRHRGVAAVNGTVVRPRGSARRPRACPATSRCRLTSTVTVTPISRCGGPPRVRGTSGGRPR